MPAFSAHNIVQRDMMSKLNTDTNDWSILALTGSWCFLAVLVVAMRIYTRTVMVRYLGLDDIFTVGTMVAGVAVWACFVGESHWALGRHMEDITPTHMKMYYKWQFAHSMLQLWSLYGMRVAFMLFLLRLSSSRIFRITLFAIVGFATVYTFSSWLTVLFACTPISANWDGKPARCISVAAYRGLGLAFSIFGMITDAILALIPIPIISRLQLNLRTKVCLLVAFGMGLTTVACGAVKTYYQYSFFANRDRLYQDSYFVWAALELYVGIIAASLVSLKPLIATFLDKAKSTLASAALIKSSHKAHSPRLNSPEFDEKKEQMQQLDTRNFPRIQVCSVSDYPLPQAPVEVVKKPELHRTNAESPRLHSSPLASNPVVPAPPQTRQKRRPAPIDTMAAVQQAAKDMSHLGGVLVSPSPTFLPSEAGLDFFDLIPHRDPETLQQAQPQQQLPSRFSASTTDTKRTSALTTATTYRSSLSVPSICGVLTSPSPTFLPTSAHDLDFFSLIPTHDPETLGQLNQNPPPCNFSRRSTKITIPDDFDHRRFSTRRSTFGYNTTRWTSMDFGVPSSATLQTVQKVAMTDVKRKPSVAPSAYSATSAYLCAPVTENFRESQMFFHVLTSGQLKRDIVDGEKTASSEEESPLSPLSVDPLMVKDWRDNSVIEIAKDPAIDQVTELVARERVDSSGVASVEKE